MKRAVLWGLLPLAPLAAHDIETAVELTPRAVIVRSAYAGTDPVAFAQVEIFSPAQAEVPFQTGRTDTNGMFSFVPDRDGRWLFIIDDELGHRVEKPIQVDRAGPAQTAPQGLGTFDKALVGIAIILGISGLIGWHNTRRMTRERRGA
jgi:nickel transport protein